MDSLYSAYETSLGLWLAEIYRDLHKNKTFGSLRLLLKLRNTKFLKQFSYLVLNCRGDARDPLIEFLLYLTALVSGDSAGQADSAFGCGFDCSGQPNVYNEGANGSPTNVQCGSESLDTTPQNQQNGQAGGSGDGNFTPMNSHNGPVERLDEEAEATSLSGTPTKMNSSSLDRTPTRRLTLLPHLSFRRALSSSKLGGRLKFKSVNRNTSRSRLRRLNSPVVRPTHTSNRQTRAPKHSRLLPGYVVFINMFLSSLVPILLYTFTQRAKNRCSSRLDVVHDLYRMLKGAGLSSAGMPESGSKHTKQPGHPGKPTHAFDSRLKSKVFRSFRTTSELSVLNAASFGAILSTIGKQNLENEFMTYQGLFNRFSSRQKAKATANSNHTASFGTDSNITASFSSNYNITNTFDSHSSITASFSSNYNITNSLFPDTHLSSSFSHESKHFCGVSINSGQIDNTSGLQMLLYRLALLGQNGPNGQHSYFEVPRDIYSVYSKLEDSVLRAQLESSLIYCYRLRINDLNLKLNVNKLFKNVIKFSKSSERRAKCYYNPIVKAQQSGLLRRSSSVNWTTVASPVSPTYAGASCGLNLSGGATTGKLNNTASLSTTGYMHLNSVSSVNSGGSSGEFSDLDILNTTINNLTVFGSNLVYLNRVLSTTNTTDGSDATDGATSSNATNFEDTTLNDSDRHIFNASKILRLINSSNRPTKLKARGSKGNKTTNSPTNSPIVDDNVGDGLKGPMKINNMEYLYNILLHLIRFIFQLKRGPRPKLLTCNPTQLLRSIVNTHSVSNSASSTPPASKTSNSTRNDTAKTTVTNTNVPSKITMSNKYDVFKQSAGTTRVFVNDTLCLLIFKINFDYYRLVFPNTCLLDELCHSILPSHTSNVTNSAASHRGLSLPSELTGAACKQLLGTYLYTLYTYVNLLSTLKEVKRRIGYEMFPISYWLVCSHLKLLQSKLDSQCQSKPP